MSTPENTWKQPLSKPSLPERSKWESPVPQGRDRVCEAWAPSRMGSSQYITDLCWVNQQARRSCLFSYKFNEQRKRGKNFVSQLFCLKQIAAQAPVAFLVFLQSRPAYGWNCCCFSLPVKGERRCLLCPQHSCLACSSVLAQNLFVCFFMSRNLTLFSKSRAVSWCWGRSGPAWPALPSVHSRALPFTDLEFGSEGLTPTCLLCGCSSARISPGWECGRCFFPAR